MIPIVSLCRCFSSSLLQYYNLHFHHLCLLLYSTMAKRNTFRRYHHDVWFFVSLYVCVLCTVSEKLPNVIIQLGENQITPLPKHVDFVAIIISAFDVERVRGTGIYVKSPYHAADDFPFLNTHASKQQQHWHLDVELLKRTQKCRRTLRVCGLKLFCCCCCFSPFLWMQGRQKKKDLNCPVHACLVAYFAV
jgi:hypothetical protein